MMNVYLLKCCLIFLLDVLMPTFTDLCSYNMPLSFWNVYIVCAFCCFHSTEFLFCRLFI